jgi:hypothetical protein
MSPKPIEKNTLFYGNHLTEGTIPHRVRGRTPLKALPSSARQHGSRSLGVPKQHIKELRNRLMVPPSLRCPAAAGLPWQSGVSSVLPALSRQPSWVPGRQVRGVGNRY